MQVIDEFKDLVSITQRLEWSNINPSSYYYTPKTGNPGRKASTTTLKTDGSTCSNHDVVEEIKNILGIEFLCYGSSFFFPSLFCYCVISTGFC